MDKIKLELTVKEYLTLLEMVYAGNAVLVDFNEAEEERYNKIESMIFSHAKEAGKEDYAEYDEDYTGYLPTREFEQAASMEEKMQNFLSASFWEELIHRLALIDVLKTVKTDNDDILMEALLERTAQYEEFFEANGLDAIRIKGMPAMSSNPSTFRSAIVGAPEGAEEDDCDCDDENCPHHHHH